MKKLIISSLILVGFMAVGCTTSRGYSAIGGARLGNFIDFRSLSRKDFSVKSNVKGEATFIRTRILLPIPIFTYYTFGIPNLTEKRDVGEIQNAQGQRISGYPTFITPGSPLDYAQEQAVYNALDKIGNADLLLQPRFAYKCTATTYILYSTETCTVTVKGKAVTINEG